MSVDSGRRLALDALLAVQRGAPLESALQRLRRTLPTGQPTAAYEELVKGALQWQGRYDHLITSFSRRQATDDARVRAVLYLALHQLLTSRHVPPYAAVHQAGELLRSVGRRQAVGYVNAVLQAIQRHVAGSGLGDPLDAVHELFIDPRGDPAGYLAAWWSFPEWLVHRWYERFGEAETTALLEHANTPAAVTLHVLPGHDAAAAGRSLTAAGVANEPLAGHPRALRLRERVDRTQLADLLRANRGVLVQDAGAQAVVDWLTREGADLAAESRPVVDLCAAPGGKTVHLRSLLPPATLLIAVDLKRRRLARVRQNRDRLAIGPVALVAGDGTRPPLRTNVAAAVLVDGPCSGTGVARRHPEGRWRLRPGTLARNHERLVQLCLGAADLLLDGGRLYYATCSLESEEGEDVVAALLASRPDLAPDPDPDGQHQRTWLPWRTGTDGFYAARLSRTVRLVRA